MPFPTGAKQPQLRLSQLNQSACTVQPPAAQPQPAAPGPHQCLIGMSRPCCLQSCWWEQPEVLMTAVVPWLLLMPDAHQSLLCVCWLQAPPGSPSAAASGQTAGQRRAAAWQAGGVESARRAQARGGGQQVTGYRELAQVFLCEQSPTHTWLCQGLSRAPGSRPCARTPAFAPALPRRSVAASRLLRHPAPIAAG